MIAPLDHVRPLWIIQSNPNVCKSIKNNKIYLRKRGYSLDVSIFHTVRLYRSFVLRGRGRDLWINTPLWCPLIMYNHHLNFALLRKQCLYENIKQMSTKSEFSYTNVWRDYIPWLQTIPRCIALKGSEVIWEGSIFSYSPL